jgi:phage N-6-adenine-methyltransferase|tara:strand:- start:565 stop:1092 length:528 start_codon:yes stop_codon:yes gene_type:complete
MSQRYIQNRNTSKVDFRTPAYIFEGAQNLFDVTFNLDVAASEENALCSAFFTEEGNALERSWGIHRAGSHVWCNPPYNKIGPWVNHAIDQLRNNDACESVTFLVPASTCTYWFEDLWMVANKIVFLSGRMKWEGPHLVKGSNAINPSVLVHLRGFCRWETEPPVSMVNIRNGEWG